MKKEHSFSKGKPYKICKFRAYVIFVCFFLIMLGKFFYFNKGGAMKKIGVISAVLDDPVRSNQKFNDIVSEYQNIIRGRMGIPFTEEHISVVSITVCGSLDEINELTGKLGNIQGVTVKTAISKKTI